MNIQVHIWTPANTHLLLGELTTLLNTAKCCHFVPIHPLPWFWGLAKGGLKVPQDPKNKNGPCCAAGKHYLTFSTDVLSSTVVLKCSIDDLKKHTAQLFIYVFFFFFISSKKYQDTGGTSSQLTKGLKTERSTREENGKSHYRRHVSKLTKQNKKEEKNKREQNESRQIQSKTKGEQILEGAPHTFCLDWSCQRFLLFFFFFINDEKKIYPFLFTNEKKKNPLRL